ncbi:unnamed protein product [Phyllotreta striolata]|uniref:cAMP-dependent protein kinase n=1 Tax=Phyllotreta striolata TaxID=444603 RepID=A0A9N9XRH1_PHYSR|nr:unnamed protein product [Phyllotreta striolata]
MQIFSKDFFKAKEKNKSKSLTYYDVLHKLHKDFLQRWERHTISSSEGLEKMIKIKTLGSGSFGRVLLVKCTTESGPEYYAMKCIEKQKIIKTKQVEHTLYEKRIMESIGFPFIISLKYCFKDNSYIYFVMPFINGGEMFTHLRRMRKFPENLSKFYASQVLLALEFLHYCHIIYRDLKPENILIDHKGYLKIADLGFCKVVEGRTWTLCGTPEYIAPEIILSKGYGTAVDWWSYGVLLFEMSAGWPPFTSRDEMEVYEKIVAVKYKCPGFFTNELRDLIGNLLQRDLSRRYGNLRNGVMDIKNHKWFKDVDFWAIYRYEVNAPFKPAVLAVYDTSNFDNYDELPFVENSQDKYADEFQLF